MQTNLHRPTLSRTKRLAALVIVGAMTSGLVALAPGANAVIGQIRANPDYRLANQIQPTPARGDAGPTLAVNPANQNHILETHQDLVREECEFNVSFDGGSTWSGGDLDAPVGYPVSNPGPCSVIGHGASNIDQTAAAFGSGATPATTNAFVTWTSSTAPGAVPYDVLFSRSTNGGTSFGAAIAVPGLPSGDYSFPELVVDRRTTATNDDRIYIAVRNNTQSAAYVVRSDDSGTTWGAPVEASNINEAVPTWDLVNGQVTQAGNLYRRATEVTQPVLTANGDLYVAWRGAKSPPSPSACPPTVAAPNASCESAGETGADAYLVVAKSTDLGATWTRTRAAVMRGFINPGGSVFNGSNYPRLAAAPTGSNIYVTFNQGPGFGPSGPAGFPSSNNCGTGPFPAGSPGAGATNACPTYVGGDAFQAADHFINWDVDVWFIRSTNGGSTWSGLKQLNDPKKTGLAATEFTQTRHPQVTVAPDGRVDVAWHDRRHWYLNTSTRKNNIQNNGTGTAGYPCVHTHIGCEEARLGDTYWAYSTDGGTTFGPNRRLNDRSHNNDVGYDYRFSTYWDYGPSLVALGNEQVLVANHDSRAGNVNTDAQDLYLRKVGLNSGSGAIPVEAVGGGNARALAVNLSKRVNPGGSEGRMAATFASTNATRVVIVNENSVGAALAGSVLARGNVGPLLASPAAGLTPAVKAEVDRMDPIGAYVIGDTTALSAQVETDLAGAGVPLSEIIRVSGANMAATAAQIADTLDRRAAADKTSTPPLPAFDAAVIANASSAEAVSAAALAANRRLPVLYVDQNSIPSETSAALSSLAITKTLVVGGSGVISAGVMSSLTSGGYNPTRLSGADQYAVSEAVISESVARGLPQNIVYVADGAKPMHAALLGASVARAGGLLMLVPGASATTAESRINALGLRPVVDRIVTSTLATAARVADFDGDADTDISVFRPSNGGWFSNSGLSTIYGSSGDIPVRADYDGDGTTDVAIFRPSNGLWSVRNSSTNTDSLLTYGVGSDIPVPGDYDGDSRTDIAVFRPSLGAWYIRNSSTNTDTIVTFGFGGDIPVIGDYDGDGRSDIAVFRPSTSTWFAQQSSGGTFSAPYGAAGDIPVPGDYDGDGLSDTAVFRPSTGTWFTHRSSTNSSVLLTYGVGSDQVQPGDYDGDGKTDIAIFRGTLSTWYVRNSSNNSDAITTFGLSTDIPLPLPNAVRRFFY